MQRKLFRTSFMAILMLFSLFLSGCSGTKPPPFLFLISVPKTEISYNLDEPYFITVQYGHIWDTGGGGVAFISCRGSGEDKTTLTEPEVLTKIEPFWTEENYLKSRKGIGKVIYEFEQSVTVEVPQSHVIAEKGYIQFIISFEEYSEGVQCHADSIRYEKKDGRIYFETIE